MHGKIALASFFVFLVSIGCNSSPTVPVPPPEMIIVHAPSDEGMATVLGMPGSAIVGDSVMVFNKNLGLGVVSLAEDDGSFEAEIEASSGHRLSIQLIRDDMISENETIVVVPDPDTQ